MSEGVFLAPFQKGSTLRLMPAQNGGWMVMEEVGEGLVQPILGAFTDAEDMLLALGNALVIGTVK